MGPSLGGDEGNRTPDPLLAKQVLSQLSYTPIFQGLLVGFSRYSGEFPETLPGELVRRAVPSKLNNAITSVSTACPSSLFLNLNWSFELRILYSNSILLRKEVIQPHLPIRLPCYDFTPVINPTFGGVLIAVRLPTSGVTDSHGVTGGVYKARERIHRSMLICDY